MEQIIYLLEVNLQVLMEIQFQPTTLHLGMEIHGISWEQTLEMESMGMCVHLQ